MCCTNSDIGHIGKRKRLPSNCPSRVSRFGARLDHFMIKALSAAYIRMAIGQVLEYTHLAKKRGATATPVILLPGRP